MHNTDCKSNPGPVKLGSVLQDFMQNVVDEKASQYQVVSRLWEKLVPESLAQHCSLAEIESGIIHIEADSPAAVFELRMEAKRILSQIQKSCPALRIKRLKFVIK